MRVKVTLEDIHNAKWSSEGLLIAVIGKVRLTAERFYRDRRPKIGFWAGDRKLEELEWTTFCERDLNAVLSTFKTMFCPPPDVRRELEESRKLSLADDLKSILSTETYAYVLRCIPVLKVSGSTLADLLPD